MSIVKLYKFLICFLLLVSCSTMNTSSNNYEKINFVFPGKVNEWNLVNPEPDRYNADTLFDYIDGNAEVYRSLGVKEVLAYRWANPQQIEILVDIFDMGNSSSAYGAYHNDIRDQEDIGIGVESECMNNSLAFWKDRYFVSITGMGDSPEIKQTVIELGKIIDQQIPNKGNPPQIISLLPEKGLVKSNLHYFKEYNLLKVHYYITEENVLQLGKNTEGVLVRYNLPEQQEQMNVIVIRYPKKEAALLAEQNLKNLLDKSNKLSEEEQTKMFGFESILIHSCENYLILITDWKQDEIANSYLNQIVQKIKK